MEISRPTRFGYDRMHRIDLEDAVGCVAQVVARHALNKVSMTHNNEFGLRPI